MIQISICICTRKRTAGLQTLLGSFEEMQIPCNTSISVIVVENDSENFSESIIKEFSLKSKFKIRYFLERNQGIAFARNRSVKEAGDCDFCCFTDDDQVVASDWLKELLKCQNEFNSDGVAGPTLPSFDKEVPAYIKHFHTPKTYQYGTIVNSAFTGCLLLRKKYLNLIEGPFNVRLNFTGGEDSFLTKQVIDLGGIIRYNPDAIAYEIIPQNRTTIKFVINRSFRIANTGLFVRALREKDFNRLAALPRVLMRFGNGLLILIPFLIFGKENRLIGLIKITKAVGGFSFILGRKNQFYK